MTHLARHAVVFPVLLAAIAAPQHVRGDERADYFEKHIRPLFAQHCIECHGPDTQESGLRLDTAASLRAGGDSEQPLVTDNPDDSLLIQAVRYSDDIQMPPDEQLGAEQVQHLVEWVRQGALWPETTSAIESARAQAAAAHWAFQPVHQPTVPVRPDVSANEHFVIRNAIDAFVDARIRQHGLRNAPEADRRTQIRRLSYTLTGLPPTFAETQAFADNTSTEAWADLVDRYLESPAYGEHWARHWLDIARYSDTKGYVYAREERFWVHAWTYRDWVVRAFNEDLPYDRFLLLQIAADQVADAGPEDLAAMGFLTLGRRFLGVQRDIIDDRIDVVTRGTMSLTVGCARCHDHKYDPIPTADYYSLYGVFASCRERLVPLPHDQPDAAFDAELDQRTQKLRTTLQNHREATAARHRARLADYLQAQFELEKYPDEGFDQVFSTSDLLPSGVRRWQRYLHESRLSGSPVFSVWHEFVRSDGSETPDQTDGGVTNFAIPADTNPLVAATFRDVPATRSNLVRRYATLLQQIDDQWKQLLSDAEDAGQPLPRQFADPDAEQLREVLYGQHSPCVVPDEPVVHTEYDFDSAACNELWKLQGEVDRWIINEQAERPFAVVLNDRDRPVDARIFRRGDPAQKGDQVPRQFLQLLGGPERQPFQQGSGRLEMAHAIIAPTNPLTARVIVNRIWAHHFGHGLVATPGDFGTRAAAPSHPQLLDWLATWFMKNGWSVKQLHRLILTSSTFRQASHGPDWKSTRQHELEQDPENRLLWRMNVHRLTFEEMRDSTLRAAGLLDTTAGGKPVKLFSEPFTARRTIYGLIDRQFLPGTLRMFDFANPDLHIPRRSETTVPQQALFLMNHPMSLNAVKAAAAVAAEQGTARDAVATLYRRILQRTPTSEELAAAQQFVAVAPPDAEVEPSPTVAAWAYGYGKLDEDKARVSSFESLPHFTGTAWQGGAEWPDATLGWVQLTATGGHPGNDRGHASVRRWTAPRDLSIRIDSKAAQSAAPGDGIRLFIVSSRGGILSSATIHQQEISLDVPQFAVRQGETIDFLCDIGDVLNSDQHEWRIRISTGSAETPVTVWNSEQDFTRNDVPSLTPLEQFAQILLCSNEFFFVD